MAQGILVDTEIIIDYLRGDPQARKFFDSLNSRPSTSIICLAELYSGIRNEREQADIERFLLVFELLPVDERIARLAGQFRLNFGRSHGTGLADAIIAATAHVHGYNLATSNHRHYPMLSGQLVRYPKAN